MHAVYMYKAEQCTRSHVHLQVRIQIQNASLPPGLILV